MESIMKLDNVEYSYNAKSGRIKAVKNVSGEFLPGKVYAIIGRSGSGKSTLISLMAGLDKPDKGEIYFKDKLLSKINRDYYRSHHVGMIFQQFNLIPHLTALENARLSMELSGCPGSEHKKKASQLLEKVGIDAAKASRRVLRLSGGEQQRVAIARALGSNPPLILADEPTGNLDSETGDKVTDILVKLVHEENRCVVVVTHSQAVAKMADEVWEMNDGVLKSVII